MTSTATTPGDQRAAGGLPLRQVAKDHPDELVGRAWRGECFPLLTKFIDASGALLVHLHADDETAQRLEGQANGKTEAWHILEAAPGATALCGVKAGFGREQLHTALLQQDFDAVLRRLPVRAGETIYVPGGTPHSFGPDTLVYEIEQTSDIQQHAMHWQMEDGSPVSDEQFQANIKMFMQEVKFEPKPDFGPGLAIRVDDGVEQVFLTAGPYFALERWRAGTAAPVRRKYETAQILSNVGPRCACGSATGWSDSAGPRRCCSRRPWVRSISRGRRTCSSATCPTSTATYALPCSPPGTHLS